MATATITLKTDTTANWESSNRILALNEPALERTTDGYINMKLGDGVTPWANLDYVFQFKRIEEIGTESENAIKTTKDYLALCIDEYNKTKALHDEYSNKIDILCDNAETATNAANEAAEAARNVVENKIGINDESVGNTTTYSSKKILDLIKASKRPKEWGVRFFDGGSSSYVGTRLGDAVNLIAAVGTDTNDAYNDFDYLTPWKTRRVNGYWEDKNFIITAVEGEPNFALDGSNGDVFTERNLFYYKYVFNDDGSYEIWISDTHLDGYSIPERFINLDKSVMDTYYYPCYKISIGSDGKPHSISGADTQLNRSYQTYYDLIRNNLGSNYSLETTKDRQINELLFEVEFATLNVQSVMYGCANMRYSQEDKSFLAGTNQFITTQAIANNYVVGQCVAIGTTKNGEQLGSKLIITDIGVYDSDYYAITISNPSGVDVSVPVDAYISSRAYRSGGTDSVKTPSGSPVSNINGKYQMRYRYVEDFWGNQWSIIGDVLVNEHQTYVCDDVTKFNKNTCVGDENYKAVGYVNAESDGYYKKLGWDAKHPSVRLPTAVGGSAATFYCDYYYQAAGLRAVCVGGVANFGAGAGFSWYCNDAVGSTPWYVAGRLSHSA